MLKIGVVRWRGKCSRHPSFDPYSDGLGGVKGGCARCLALVEIHQCHQKMMGLMRGFAPVALKKKARDAEFEDRQESLFG